MKVNLTAKFKQLWKLTMPFYFFITVSFALLIGLFSFVSNISSEVKSVWEQGHFRNIEWRGTRFSQEQKENHWQLRPTSNEHNFIFEYINNLVESNDEDIYEFIEEVGSNSGMITPKIINLFPNISAKLLNVQELNLIKYNNNLLDALMIEEINQHFPENTNIFSARLVAHKVNDLNQNKLKFFISPTSNKNDPFYTQQNNDSDFHILSKIKDQQIEDLENNYIFISPSDLKELNLNIGDKYFFSSMGQLIETTIAGTATSKTTIAKEQNTNHIFAPIDFLLKNNLIESITYGIYLQQAADDYKAASDYFNNFLNNYFINDNLDLYVGNYIYDANKAPYFTMYKNPLMIFQIIAYAISILVFSLILISYLWISLYSIHKQKEILWTLKANGTSNWILAFSQMLGDLVPQFVAFIFAVPLSIIIYKIFWSVGANQYIFDLSNKFVNLFAFLINFAFLFFIMSMYLIVNFFVISKRLRINNPKIHISKFYKLFKSLHISSKKRINLSISWPNIGKALISGIIMLITFWTISFGILFTSSLYNSALESQKYMAPYKNASGQLIENDTSFKVETPDEYSYLDFYLLKQAIDENNQNALFEFIKYLQPLNPLEYKISSEDIAWLSNVDIPEQLQIVKNIQNKLNVSLWTLKNQYKKDIYPEFYFKYYPHLEFASSLNLEFKNEIIFNFVLLDTNQDIFKDIHLIDNEVILTTETHFQFSKWNHLQNDTLTLELKDKKMTFKVKGVNQNLQDKYYIYANKDYFIKKYFDDRKMYDNTFYLKESEPLITEMLVFQTIDEDNKGTSFSDYIDLQNLGISDMNIFISDYQKISEFIFERGSNFSNIGIYTSYILILISFILIALLVTLTIISNYELIRYLKQMGYNSKYICRYISFSYIFATFIALNLMYVTIGLITKQIALLLSNLIGINLNIYYDLWTFMIPLIIFVLFSVLIFYSLKIFYKKIKII
ncbi:ABC transporter permease family protein [Spiroplasma culicicola]|nr:ABC transporter permease [Spiroplasma culicicola]